MTGVEGIPDDVLARAVEAAARARSDQWSAETVRSGRGWAWDELDPEDQAKCVEWVEPIVTAALAEVESSLTAERDDLAARIARVEALADRWEAGLTGTPRFKSGTRHYLNEVRETLRGES